MRPPNHTKNDIKEVKEEQYEEPEPERRVARKVVKKPAVITTNRIQKKSIVKIPLTYEEEIQRQLQLMLHDELGDM